MVRLNVIEPTDRDSYKCKRVHASGTSYAKSFKTYFNASIVQQIKRRITKDFKSMSFSQIDLASTIRSSIYGADFERSIMQTITSGNKSQITINKKTKVNRLSSQLLDRKNQIAAISTLRQITTTTSDSSKQSERANEMRRVHMSFLGYICCIHSSDGEKVGINKQLAIFASILCSSSSVVLREILINDSDLILLNDACHKRISEQQLKNVYINGEWIGFTNDTIKFINKYRKMRRELKIHPYTTIHWNNMENEVYFWVDVGRVSRPLLIVYNNKRDSEHFPKKKYSENHFIQGLKIDSDVIDKLKTKKIDITYLLENNIIEYITAEEQENCYICPFYDQLKDDKNNELKEYTHCDIPQSILGFTGLTGPFANHNNAPRITFQGNQCRQTCGVFALNWPFRCDKDTFLQYLCETPLVKTVATKYILPNGTNTIVAIACYSGYNQEDSIVVSKGAVDRGLFNGCKFTFVKSELDQHEEFSNPDATNTLDIKSGSYSKITDGIISKGIKLKNNDIVIGKTIKLHKTHDSTYTHMDKSVVYKSSEDAIVHNVINNRNDDDEKFVKVCMRKNRPVAVGDKFSVKGTSQVLTNFGWVEIKNLDMRHKVATLNKKGHLDYVVPSGLSKYNYNDNMYLLKTPDLNIYVTKNHKLYVKPINSSKYNLYETYDVINKKVKFKKNSINTNLHREFITLYKYELNINKKYFMTPWLKLLGIFISCGDIKYINKNNIEEIQIIFNICNSNILQRNTCIECLYELGIVLGILNNYLYISGNKYPDVLDEFTKLKNENNNYLPEYVWTVSQTQCQILLNTLLISSEMNYNMDNNKYYTSSISLSNDISRLALHSGWSGVTYPCINILDDDELSININPMESLSSFETYNKIYESYYVEINKTNNEPHINYDIMDEYSNSDDNTYLNIDYKKSYYKIEKYEKYSGDVYCLEIPDTHTHVYYSRENDFSPPCWTGNSSRHGQKGVTGILLRDSDMPFTEDGIKPCLIINPHAIPSRMTIGQLYEMQAGHYCAAKGTHIDATIFKKVDIEQMGNELELMGYERYGYHRLYSGITGEYIDSLIFMGPTYYQRLQKFVIDSIYSIGKGPSDVLSRQPLDGKSSGGGLRIGEMERDVLCSHGAAKVIHEKYFEHSDIFNEYICRCGKPAIVNVDNNIYKCKYCKDNADIAEVQTSWSSKLFMQELDSMNIGVCRQIEPFTYENIMVDK
jgi:DNA-directed RNA polymerase beta subunit